MLLTLKVTSRRRKPQSSRFKVSDDVRNLGMLLRLRKFFAKSPQERRQSLRYLARVTCSKLPYLPFRFGLRLPSGENLAFWWSYVPASLNFDLPGARYWGDDIPEMSYLWRSLKPGMTFVDIGAHHGIWTLIAAKAMGKGGRIIAFEPSQRERQRLALHIRLNGISCAKVEPYAVSSGMGRASFFVVESSSWSWVTSMNGLRRPGIDDRVREIQVDTVGLDDYLKDAQVRTVDMLKVDTEGAELEVFSGAKHLLADLRPCIICEVLDGTAKLWGYPARAIIHRLIECGYKWFDFEPDGTLSTHRVRDEYREGRNYLAAPLEKIPRLTGLNTRGT
jgi:FkbM family methyltransferase